VEKKSEFPMKWKKILNCLYPDVKGTLSQLICLTGKALAMGEGLIAP